MFEETLARVAASLATAGIPYMIIGGQAVLLYGEPRLTANINVALGIAQDRLDDLLSCISAAKLTVSTVDIEDFVKKTMVVPARDEKTGLRVDFILSFTPYEAQAIERTRTVGLLGTDVAFASPEDLIIHKLFAGRPRDLEDVEGILLHQDDLDVAYIEKWLIEFDASFPDKHYLKTFRDLLLDR